MSEWVRSQNKNTFCVTRGQRRTTATDFLFSLASVTSISLLPLNFSRIYYIFVRSTWAYSFSTYFDNRFYMFMEVNYFHSFSAYTSNRLFSFVSMFTVIFCPSKHFILHFISIASSFFLSFYNFLKVPHSLSSSSCHGISKMLPVPLSKVLQPSLPESAHRPMSQRTTITDLFSQFWSSHSSRFQSLTVSLRLSILLLYGQV